MFLSLKIFICLGKQCRHFIMVFTVCQGMHLGVTSLFSFFSGLGYIVGANVAAAFHAWQYALRVSHLQI